MIKRFSFLILALAIACNPKTTEVQSNTDNSKVITAGGTITEIVDALGMGDLIIATDITSTFPASMQELPSIGYRNQIKAEGILALGPDLILMEEGYLSEDVVNQLRTAQIEIHSFAKPNTVSGTIALIEELGELLDQKAEAESLKAQLNQDLEDLNTYLKTITSKPKAAFIMARGPQTVFLAGEDTFAQEIFQMANLEFPATGFKDFVPITPESIVKINPDYLVFFESGIQSLGGTQGLSKIQGIDQTSAFKKNQIIALDGNYLSGFGPRVGKAALELAKAARGE
jgi:iron complex transport system substrate-binding protein